MVRTMIGSDCRASTCRWKRPRTALRGFLAVEASGVRTGLAPTTPAARGTDRGTNDRTWGSAGDVGEPAKALVRHHGAPERLADPGLRRREHSGSNPALEPAVDLPRPQPGPRRAGALPVADLIAPTPTSPSSPASPHPRLLTGRAACLLRHRRRVERPTEAINRVIKEVKRVSVNRPSCARLRRMRALTTWRRSSPPAGGPHPPVGRATCPGSLSVAPVCAAGHYRSTAVNQIGSAV